MKRMATNRKLLAGVAKRDITTDREDVVVNDPLYAKALVLDDGDKQVVIVALDALAVGGIGDIKEDFLPKLRAGIASELGIPGSHVLVNSSHTHPQGRLLCEDDEQVARTLDAVKEAWSRRIEVTAGVGVGHENRLSVNRNLTMKDGKHWTIRYAHPCPPDEDVAAVGPIDDTIGIVRFDRADGSTHAVLYNFACHPLMGVPSRAVTANYPGFASALIEETLGGGAMALFLQGAAGDIVEEQFKDHGRARDAEPGGIRLGLSVLKALRGILTKDADLGVALERISLPRRTDIPDVMAALREEQAALLGSLRSTCLNLKTFVPLYVKYGLNPEYPSDYSYKYLQNEAIGNDELVRIDEENRRNLQKYADNIRVMERLTKIEEDLFALGEHQRLNEAAGFAPMETEVMGIRIGECVLITAPGEALVEIGFNVKRASPYEYTFMSAYTNGFVDYAAPVHHYAKGGYEVVECHLAPQWQHIYEAAAGRVISKL